MAPWKLRPFPFPTLVWQTLFGCGLTLVLLATLACGPGSTAEVAGWHCPMHPTYTSDKPGECPICGMQLVPIPAASPNSTANENPAPDTSALPGLSAVATTTPGTKLAGVRTAVAQVQRWGQPTRTVGLVQPDERRIRHVHTKISGWVEQLHVNFTGQLVRRGQPILALYSPELLASQEEYLRARHSAHRFALSTIPEVREGGAELVSAARRRLELFDVPGDFLAALEHAGQAQRAVTLVAPTAGYVTSKQVVEGMQVEPGMELFTLTDLSHVWVEAELYEAEARWVNLGQVATITSPYAPGQPRVGQVTYVYPTLSPESRTLKVRLELDNPDGQLKPGMFVDVLAELQSSEGITVPDDSIIDTGLRQVVFVEIAPGNFEPRLVQVGLRGQGLAILLQGVAAGERVATRANFLLDSESRLRAALAASQLAIPTSSSSHPLPPTIEPMAPPSEMPPRAAPPTEPDPHAGHHHHQ